MSNDRTCPTCQTQLPADAPGGLCPQCLLRLAAGDGTERTSSFASPGRSGFVAPSVDAMAARFPQFEVLDLLGRGGMGAVYKARQIGLDRLVAVKVLPPEVGDAHFARRFFQEARALAALDHPNIIRVYDVGQTDGLYYFFMEYVDGVNLREAIRAGSLTSSQALAVVGQICDALQYAHDHGVVHRDIKPENILLDKRGRVKIADFGLAKLLRQDEIDHGLTGTHQVMGTPRYMAPEQLEGTKTVDHRADIYSLGVVFYELLTGELPLGRFAAPSKKADIDARLDEVVLRTLEKEPAERYQQASEVKTDMDAIASVPRASLPTTPGGGSVTVQQQLAPRGLRDMNPLAMLLLIVPLLYFPLPAAVGWFMAALFDLREGDQFAISMGCGLGVLFAAFVFFSATSIRAARIDARGIRLDRYVGPARFIAWEEVDQFNVLTDTQVVRRVWTFPGFLPRGSIVGMSAWPYFEIQTERGSWYFCPSDIPAFITALARHSPVSMPIPATDDDDLDALVRGQGRQLSHVSPAPERRPRWLPTLAAINIVVAVLFLLMALTDDPLLERHTGNELYRAYSYASAAASYLSSAVLLAGSVGLLLGKGWGRRLTIGVCVYALAMFVIEMPFAMRFSVLELYYEIEIDLLAEGTEENLAAILAGLFSYGVVTVLMLIALAWTIWQLYYLTRPRVAAALEPLSPAWSTVRVPLTALFCLLLLACVALAGVYISPLGPAMTDHVEVTARPKSNDYESLRLQMKFVEPRMFAAADQTSPRTLEVYFDEKSAERRPRALAYVLRVDLATMHARYGEVGASSSLVFDDVEHQELARALGRTLGPPKDELQRQRECEALLKLIESVAAGPPAQMPGLLQRAKELLGGEFDVTQGATLSHMITGVRHEWLLGALAATAVLFALLVAIWVWMGRSIVAAGEKPLLRARREVELLARSLQWLGLASLLSIGVVIPLMLSFEDHGPRTNVLEVLVPLVGGGLFLAGPLMVIAGFRAKTSTTAAWIGSALALYPLSPLAPLTIPVGVWGLWLLSRGDVAQAIERVKTEQRAAAEEQMRPYRRDESVLYQVGTVVGMVQRRGVRPATVATLLSVVGALSIFLPWERVTLILTPHERAAAPIHRERDASGFEGLAGNGVAAIFVAVGLVLFATGTLRSRYPWRAALFVVAALAVFACMINYHDQARFMIHVDPPSQFNSHYSIARRVEPLAGFYVPGAAAFGYIVVAAWLLRQAFAEPAPVRGQGESK